MSANVGITIEASRLAFQIGQKLEGLLIDRSLEVASAINSKNVTAKQIESCFDLALFDELITSVKESINNGPRGGRTEGRNSGEAA